MIIFLADNEAMRLVYSGKHKDIIPTYIQIRGSLILKIYLTIIFTPFAVLPSLTRKL
jgi:hypothetical protein